MNTQARTIKIQPCPKCRGTYKDKFAPAQLAVTPAELEDARGCIECEWCGTMLYPFSDPRHIEVNINHSPEARILRDLLRQMDRDGYQVKGVWDFDETHRVTTDDEILKLVFGMDECHLLVGMKGKGKYSHRIYLIPFNGDPEDMFADWTFYKDDHDGFEKFMKLFMDRFI